MIFKDRIDAGQKLGFLLKEKVKNVVVVSLLRGGAVVGCEVAKILKAPHLALPVSKISSPTQAELAIGALCFDEIYLDRNIINSLGFGQKTIVDQIEKAREKFTSYLKGFNIKKSAFSKVKNKTTILVDDGIATGATIKTGALFLKTQRPKKIVVASPIAPYNFPVGGFDEVVIYHRDPQMSAISRFYKEFPQLEDNQIKKLLKN